MAAGTDFKNLWDRYQHEGDSPSDLHCPFLSDERRSVWTL